MVVMWSNQISIWYYSHISVTSLSFYLCETWLFYKHVTGWRQLWLLAQGSLSWFRCCFGALRVLGRTFHTAVLPFSNLNWTISDQRENRIHRRHCSKHAWQVGLCWLRGEHKSFYPVCKQKFLCDTTSATCSLGHTFSYTWGLCWFGVVKAPPTRQDHCDLFLNSWHG